MPSRRELANAIRALSMDAVQQANSGHPGAPMGMADIAEVLWNDFLSHNPSNPNWFNRDRFVLSNGHGSLLLYSILHLTGYELPIEELKNFRQLHSKTPGHPEFGYTPGVETTTGPLGQGLANAVGMAIAEKTLAGQFNKPEHEIIDHHSYVFLGDGCLMEGISHEACSLAGTLGLGKLIALYDDNGISIDGEVEGWFTDDTVGRFEAYGWQVISGVDGHNAEAVGTAIRAAKSDTARPSIILCKTIIGFGSPNKQGNESCHGAPLGDEEVALTRKNLQWPHAPFEIPLPIYESWDAVRRGAAAEQEWKDRLAHYTTEYPQLAEQLKRRIDGELPAQFGDAAEKYIRQLQADGASIASRKASQNALSKYGPLLPEILGGSADLAGSNLTIWEGCSPITAEDSSGNYLHYGVREFGMSAIMNGITRHGGFIAYGATFLIFMEYARNAVRLAALMNQPSIFVYTHDSIGLGEDGPTHQPVEQLASLRNTPSLVTWRPCDTVETAVAWRTAIERRDGPSALVFSRQSLQHQERSEEQIDSIQKGAYILYEPPESPPQAILIATGSEVELAMQAALRLKDRGVPARVVSMPSSDQFDAQDPQYRDSVLPPELRARVAIEASHKDFWTKYVGLDGQVLGMTGYGESAPADALYEHFGLTVDNAVALVESTIK